MSKFSAEPYSKENLASLLEENLAPNRIQYLYNSNQPLITPHIRERLINWIFDTARNLSSNPTLPQLAATYIDIFLENKKVSHLNVLELVGTVSIGIALKYLEGKTLTPKHIFHMLDRNFTVDSIVTTELFLLNCLDWKLSLPTPSEISRALLVQSCEVSPTKLEEMGDNFAALCLANEELCKEGDLLISVGSLACAMDKLGFGQFQNDWLEWIEKTQCLSANDVLHYKQKVYKALTEIAKSSG